MVQIDTSIVEWALDVDHKRSISGVAICLGLVLYIGGPYLWSYFPLIIKLFSDVA